MFALYALLASSDPSAPAVSAPDSPPYWLYVVLTTAMIALVVCVILVREKSAALMSVTDKLKQSDHDNRNLNSKIEELEVLLQNEAKHPHFDEIKYSILTMGVPGCGKTALTLKWTNPLIDVGKIPGTSRFQEYSKPISVVKLDNGNRVLHSYTIYDRGGEFRNDTIDQLVTVGAQALLLVVDVAEYDKQKNTQIFSEARVKEQLQRFNKWAIEVFFTDRITANCKHYILFINKCDVLLEHISGGHEAIEKEALRLYQQLITDMQAYTKAKGVYLHVIVGSAAKGTGTDQLVGTLIRNLLPEDGLDEALKFMPAGYDAQHTTLRKERAVQGMVEI